MADYSVGARDESRESEASWALMFCFDNVSSEKACFVVNLVCSLRAGSLGRGGGAATVSRRDEWSEEK